MPKDLVLRIKVDDSGAAVITNWGDSTRRELERTETGYKRFGSTTKSVAKAAGVALVAIKAAVATVAAVVIDAASDFESSFAGVRKTVNATEEEFAGLETAFRSMAKQIPVNVNELNAIGEAAGQLGIDKAHIVGFTEVVAKLGVTTNLSSEEAATSLARLANITQMPQSEFDRLGSTVVHLGNNFATTESEIVDFGTRMAAAGNIAGLNEAEILAFGAAMSSVGLQAEAGGTALQKVMIEITSAVKSGGDKLEEFARVAGLSVQEFKQLFREDAAEAITLFIEGLGRLDEEGQNVFSVLESVEFQNERVRRALLSAAGAGDLLRGALVGANQAWRDNDALTKEAETRFGTFRSQWILLKNAINDVSIRVGQMLLPVWRDIVQSFRVFVNREGPNIARAIGVFFVEALQLATDALGIFGGAVNRVKIETNRLGGFFTDLKLGFLELQREDAVRNLERFADELERTGSLTENQVRMFENEKQRLHELDLQIAQTTGTNEGFKDGMADAAEANTRLNEILDRGRSVLERWKGMISDAAAETQVVFAPAVEVTADMIGQLPDAYHRLPPLLDKTSLAFEDQEALLVDFYVPTLRDAIKAHDKAPDLLKLHEKALREAARAQEQFFRVIQTGITWLDSLVEGVFRLIDSLVGGGGLAGALQGVGGIASGIFGGVGNTAGQLAGGILSRAGAAGGIGSLLGLGGTGAAAASTGFTGISAGTTFATGGGAAAGGGGLMGSMAGLMTNPWTIGIAGGALGVFGLYKWLSKTREEARAERQADIFSDFGISQQTVDTLRDLSIEATKAGRALPDTVASIKGLGAVLQETGISSHEQFLFAASKAREGIERLNQGILTEQEVVTMLNDVMPTLIENLDLADEAGRTAFQGIVDGVRESGLEIESVTGLIEDQIEIVQRFIDEALSASAGAINRFAGSFRVQVEGPDGAQVDSFEGLQNNPAAQELLSLQFNTIAAEMQANGANVLEILEALGPTLDIANEAGIRLGGQFAFLQGLAGQIAGDEGIGRIIERQSALNDLLKTNADLNLLTQDSFNTFQENAVAGHKELTELLGNENLAIRAQGPLLARLAHIADVYGFELDDATRALIEQGDKLGALPEIAEPIETIMSDIRAILLGMAEAFGVDLPDSVRRFRDRASTDLSGVVDDTRNAADDIRNNLDDAFRSTNNLIGDGRFGGHFTFEHRFVGGDDVSDTIARNIEQDRGDSADAGRRVA